MGADIAVSTCHRKKKQSELCKKKKDVPWFVSFHFVINNYSIRVGDMETLNAGLGFWDPNLSGAKKILVEGYDNSVYSDGQNFRMIYQTKPGSDAPQIPLTMADEPHHHTIRSRRVNISFSTQRLMELRAGSSKVFRRSKSTTISILLKTRSPTARQTRSGSGVRT